MARTDAFCWLHSQTTAIQPVLILQALLASMNSIISGTINGFQIYTNGITFGWWNQIIVSWAGLWVVWIESFIQRCCIMEGHITKKYWSVDKNYECRLFKESQTSMVFAMDRNFFFTILESSMEWCLRFSLLLWIEMIPHDAPLLLLRWMMMMWCDDEMI